MPIVITSISGPDGQKTYEFDNDKKDILFGRSHEADIHWPHSDATAHLSARHFTLRFELGHYRIVMQSDNYVYLDGEEISDEIELPLGEHTINVGTPDGPEYKVVSTYADAALPPTAAVFKRKKTAREEARGKMKKILSLTVVLGLVTVGGYTMLTKQDDNLRKELSTVEDGMSEILASKKSLDKVLEDLKKNQAPTFQEVLPKLKKSVYLVGMKKDDKLIGMGTSWVVAEGKLATNAHVVEGIEKMKKQGWAPVVISNTAPFTVTPVTDLEKHPHYDQFMDQIKKKPVYTDTGKRMSFVSGYDVGILHVANPADLAPPLKLAASSSYLTLGAPDNVAYIGYPMEGMVGGGVIPSAPNPQMQIGNITTVSDYFLTSQDPLRNHLVQFNMGAHGGASGSPIFNNHGEVVALLSGGNVTMVNGKRIASGVDVNFGQRVDVLIEFLQGQVAQKEQDRFAFWDTRKSTFKSQLDALYTIMSSRIEKQSKQKMAIKTREMKNTSLNATINKHIYMQEVDINSANQIDLYAAYSKEGEDINMFLVNEKWQVMAKNVRKDASPYLVLSKLMQYRDAGKFTSAYIVVISQKPESFEFLHSRN